MNETVFLLVATAAALIIGFLFGRLFSAGKWKTEIAVFKEKNFQLELHLKNFKDQLDNNLEDTFGKLQKAEDQKELIRKEKDFLRNELTRRNSEFESLQQKNLEQKEEVEKLQEKFSKEFENLANRILEQKSEKFTLLNKENIQNILTPLNEKIKNFEDRIEKNNTDFIERHAQLGKTLEFLHEQNIKISDEATNLTRALKGNSQMQGNWGEMILESVLERSGLVKNHEYFVQQNFLSDDGKHLRPDVVINLPGNKKMIVDSKVSLVAYERCVNCDDEERKVHLKDHLAAVRRRVEELSIKNYHKIYDFDSPDFVLLFVPIEAAFAMASQQHPGLYSDAFEKNIIIVTPTTLLAVLKTINSMWQNEKQKQNALEIAKQAGALYDSFCNLTEDLTKVGKQINTVQSSYEGAMKKLTGKGNLINRVEKLKKLGAKTSKQLDQKLLEKTRNEADGSSSETLNLN